MRAIVRMGLALAALLAALPIAWPASAADPPATITTTLQPGLNYVGWLGPDTEVEELFDQLPEAAAIFGWQRSEQRWLAASRAAAPSSESFTVSSGAGLVIRLEGKQAVAWERPFSRASGFIPLRPGWNLIAWSAEQDASLDQLEQDLRPSFHPWPDSASEGAPSEFAFADPLAPTDQQRGSRQLAQGDALWVHASKGGYWQQRADALVSIRGQITSDDGQSRAGLIINAQAIEGDWFDGVIGADGQFEIVVRADRSYRLRLNPTADCSLRYQDGLALPGHDDATILKVAGDLTLPQFHIPESACAPGLRGRIIRHDGTPVANAGVVAWRLDQWQGIPARTSADGHFTLFPSRLYENPDQAVNITIRPQPECLLWYSGDGVSMSWQDAARVDLKEEFIHLDIVIPQGFCTWQIHGQALTEDGEPIPALRVRPYYDDGAGPNQDVITAPDGTFQMTVAANGTYHVVLHEHQACTFVDQDAGQVVSRWSSGAAIATATVEVADAHVYGVELIVPPLHCNWRIRGQLIDMDGAPLPGVRIAAANSEERASSSYSAVSDADGRFVIQAGATAAYWFSFTVAGEWCGLLDGESLTRDFDQAERIEVDERGLSDLTIRLPDGFCEQPG